MTVLLSDIPEAFNSIKRECTEALNENPELTRFSENIINLIKERKEFVCKDIHYVANLLDPRYHGRCLSREEKLGASEHIAKMCDNLLYTAGQKEKVKKKL